MRTTLLALSLLLSVAHQLPGQARPKDAQAIREGVAAYDTAVNKRDIQGIGAVFASDADAIYFDSERTVGRDSIAATHRTGLAEWPPSRHFSLEVTHIRFLGPALALVETLARFSEGDMTTNRGTILMSRTGGRWLWLALRVYPAKRG